MIYLFILLVIAIGAMLIDSARDAFYYHDRYTSTEPADYNIHYIFVLERTIIWGLVSFIFYTLTNLFSTVLFAGGLILIFSFFHNGMYYFVRHKLNKNVYPKGWFDSSTTSTSWIELPVIQRTILAALGTISIIVSFTTSQA